MTRGDMAADEAMTWRDTPFVWQQCVKGRGADCKMLAAGVARECGFSEAQSIWATMADYSDQRRVPSATLRQGLEELFDRVEFDRGAASRGEIPPELRPGDHLLLVMAKDPNHLAIVAPRNAAGEVRTAVHAKIGSRSAVTETGITVLLRKYRLDAVYRYRDAPNG